MGSKTVKILTSVSAIVIALLLLGLSILGILKKDEVTYKDVQATIVRIEEEYNQTEEQYEYTVFVDYEVDGVRYKGVEYGAYDSSMNIGDKVTAKYNTENPEFIQAEGSEKVPYIVGAAGFAVAVFGIVSLVKAIREE